MTFLPLRSSTTSSVGNQDLADLFGEAESLGAGAQRFGHFLLETRNRCG